MLVYWAMDISLQEDDSDFNEELLQVTSLWV